MLTVIVNWRFTALGGICFGAALFSCSPPSQAQVADDPGGLTAGSILIRGRAVGVFPVGRNTTITPVGGYVQIDDSGSPELDLSYFFTNHLAIEAQTGPSRDTLSAKGTEFGNIAIGTVWTVPIIAVLQYHLLPHARWNPYFGAGIAILPTFGENPAGGAVQQLSVDSEVGAALQAGVDVHVTGPWYANADLKKLIIGISASVNDGAISATGNINPWIVGLGIGYRF